MKYTVITDDNNYIVSMYEDPNGIELPEEFDFSYMSCYQLVDDEIVLDLQKYEDSVAENEKEDELFDLKQKLKNSDYIISEWGEEIVSLSNPLTWIADVIKINLKYLAKYSDLLKSRSQWRERIHELEG